jgi:hypothetical protein
MARSAADFVTPEARYAEAAQDMSGVRSAAPGMSPYPLYGLGQADASAAVVVWYRRPMVVLPVGIALGIGIGWGIWGWFMPTLRKNVRKSMKRNEEE